MEDQNKIINFQNLDDGLDKGKDFYVTFKEKLEQVQAFPGKYNFKFIVKNQEGRIEDLKTIFPEDTIQKNESKNGSYVSVTILKEVKDADEVVAYYKKAGTIEGIMML
ncbi:hypothetical protein Pedsa_1904 [Pseudopedobacter saltans DSM 12145]|uniref:DUF493 domain-containing protein n=1 Tax=Pseudopedobacter saltans (strain ATCC 51119 / DSM 12145 / JCM 21818 / CCUG 39354 / LMG 10337 / NBRC 100064 / NCIMB 13643) TaxID=762903 RepID=F0S9A7_PSESL|nr:DUF493 family protein [Pseudopedobacter saltans]ADY52457.1 hypothetical protein Pedsa_1904 [Pseudopedobacter saltans DSM 12145]